jgi:hypothetical protein
MSNEATPKSAGKAKRRGTRKGAATVRATTPWGTATVVEEVRVAQRVGDRQFASILQLLEDDRGQPLVRVSYTSDGVARRGPVTLRPRDLARLRAALAPGSALAAAFGWSDGESRGGDA